MRKPTIMVAALAATLALGGTAVAATSDIGEDEPETRELPAPPPAAPGAGDVLVPAPTPSGPGGPYLERAPVPGLGG